MNKDFTLTFSSAINVGREVCRMRMRCFYYEPHPPFLLTDSNYRTASLQKRPSAPPFSNMGEGKSSREEFELVPGPLRHWLIGRTLVAGLALGCYANSCWGDFVFDDSEAVINNQDVDPGATSLADVFSHDFWGTNMSSRTSHKSYRPLTVLSFRLSFWLGGGRNPFHFHLANVLLHPLVCLLLLEVLNNWFSQLKTSSKPVSRVDWRAPIRSSEALVATLLFAVHPIHTESVSSLSRRQSS